MSIFSLRYIHRRDKLIPLIKKRICSADPNLAPDAILAPEAPQDVKHLWLGWKLLFIFIVDRDRCMLAAGICAAHRAPRVSVEPLVYAGCVKRVAALQLGRVIPQPYLFETNGTAVGVVPTLISSSETVTLAPLRRGGFSGAAVHLHI